MAKTIIGTVSSDKGDKTIVVTVQTRKTHPLYRKQYTVSKKFMAHDEKNEAQVGDKVAIVETRPISARKRFALDKIIEKPKLREGQIVTGETEETTAVKAEKAAKKAAGEAEAAVESKAPRRVAKKEEAPEEGGDQ